MQYLFLIYNDESKMPEAPKDPEAFAKFMAPWAEYSAGLEKAGVMRGGNALTPTATATTVSSKDGQAVFTDGPFAETREQLGGYYLVECDNLDEALKHASGCPAVAFGRVEVRPIADLSGPS